MAFSCMFSVESFDDMYELMRTSGNTGGSRSILCTTEHQNNVLVICVTQSTNMSFTDMPLCPLQMSRLYLGMHLFRVDLSDSHL